MNNGFVVIMFVGYILVGLPMNEAPKSEPIPIPEATVLPEYEQEFCCACHETIPESHSHFQYDPDHLVCIHCYFYRMPKTEEGQVGLALEYVGKNGMELRDK